MAERPVRIITKRTSVAGKIPTGTTGTELNYIKAGELASNLVDRKLYSYDGSNVFEFGSNSFLYTTGGTINGNLTVTGSSVFNSISASTYLGLPVGGNLTYMFDNIPSDIATYSAATSINQYVPSTLATKRTNISTTPTLLGAFSTPSAGLGITYLPPSVITAHFETQKVSGGQGYYNNFQLYKRTSGGTETLIGISDNSSSSVENTLIQQSLTCTIISGTTFNVTDRVIVKIFGKMLNSTADIDLFYADNTNARIEIPIVVASASWNGGTVTNSTIFTNGLSSNSISATTYLGLPKDVFVTGGTYSAGTVTFINNTGGTFSVSGFANGGSIGDPLRTSSVLLTTGSSQSLLAEITGFTNGSYIVESYITASNSNINYGIWKRTLGVTTEGGIPNIVYESADFDKVSSNFSGTSIIYSGLTGNKINVYATGLSATNFTWNSYYEIIDSGVSSFLSNNTDIFVTGGTYSAGTATFYNNTGGTFNVSGFLTGTTGGGTVFTGGTVSGETIFTNGITANTISATTYSNLPYFSGGTGLNSVFQINSTNNNIAVGMLSIAVGSGTTAIGDFSYAGGCNTIASGQSSYSEGWNTIASGLTSHAEGWNTTASRTAAHAEGKSTIASGDYSHAEGSATTASNTSSHAEGYLTIASGLQGHAEGNRSQAIGNYSHAEGQNSISSGQTSHAEGISTITFGSYAHSEGNTTTASGSASHSEGVSTQANGVAAHAEGQSTTASGAQSHTEGQLTIASGAQSHSEGFQSTSIGVAAHAEGLSTRATGDYSHAEGNATLASGARAHAEGLSTTASGDFGSHAEGNETTASNESAHAEGYRTIASGILSHAEGWSTTANNTSSHAEGYLTKATGSYAHSEGLSTIASGSTSHAEGTSTQANAVAAHAEGQSTTASGVASHSEGNLTVASGNASHTEGIQTTASGVYSHAGGTSSIASGANSFVHGTGSTASGISTIVLGNNITGTTDNTLFTNALNIKTVGSGTSVINLGWDINGNIVSGSTYTPPSINTGSTSIDFGFASGNEGDIVTATVNDANITSSSFVMYNITPSIDHETVEDALLDGLIFSTSNIVDGVSFDVNVIANNNTWGVYNFNYKII